LAGYISSKLASHETNVFKVVSPTNGKVLEVYRENFVIITTGIPIVRIGHSMDMEIVVDVLSTDAAEVRLND
jgi:hypothetical protein